MLLSAVSILTPFSWAATITPFQAYSPVLVTGTLVSFEGFSEGTPITTQYPDITFSQIGGGAPMVDNYGGGGVGGCSGAAWCYGFGASSGSGVLTGSSAPNGTNVVTTAGIVVTFANLQMDVQAFLSDTSPLGDYVVSAFGPSNNLLGSLTVPLGATLPVGYSGGFFPPPGTSPLPGVFVGFHDTLPEIQSIRIGPSSAPPGTDAFAVDDIRFGATAPEPGTLVLIGTGLVLMGRCLRR